MMEHIINLTSWLFFLSEMILLLSKRSKSGQVKVRKDRQSMLVIWIVFTACIVLSIYLANLFPRSEQLIELQWAGVCIVLIGVLVRWTAIYQLKEAFTVDVSISKDHKIKDDGMYKTIRHPSYTGLLLELLGLSLMFNSWMPLFVINIPAFIAMSYRMKIEEELLSEAFGTEYENYMKRTKRILPFIY